MTKRKWRNAIATASAAVHSPPPLPAATGSRLTSENEAAAADDDDEAEDDEAEDAEEEKADEWCPESASLSCAAAAVSSSCSAAALDCSAVAFVGYLIAGSSARSSSNSKGTIEPVRGCNDDEDDEGKSAACDS